MTCRLGPEVLSSAERGPTNQSGGLGCLYTSISSWSSEHRAEHREPLLTTPVRERPWQRISTNLFYWQKKTYHFVVDYFSRFIEVAHLNASAKTVAVALKDVFSCHGIPGGGLGQQAAIQQHNSVGLVDISCHTPAKWLFLPHNSLWETGSLHHTTASKDPTPSLAKYQRIQEG